MHILRNTLYILSNTSRHASETYNLLCKEIAFSRRNCRYYVCIDEEICGFREGRNQSGDSSRSQRAIARHNLFQTSLDKLTFQGFQSGRRNVKVAHLNIKHYLHTCPVCRTTDLVFISFLSLYGENKRLQSFR